jgi:hypothetical protein
MGPGQYSITEKYFGVILILPGDELREQLSVIFETRNLGKK